VVYPSQHAVSAYRGFKDGLKGSGDADAHPVPEDMLGDADCDRSRARLHGFR
jgi:hypothetical protein